jgi:ADP-ribosylglycohydrolase
MRMSDLGDRVAGALWGMLIADALAMPTHWFYGGARQVLKYYGKPISGYISPLSEKGSFPDSIMALSSTSSAGRGSSDGDIIGSVINHSKKTYWTRGSGYHYHCTLKRGENTLEGEMARLTMRSMSTQDGFDYDGLQATYVEFMTRPGSHNDAYASSYHRMFFANRAAGRPLRECPDNDNHNVDAIDGLRICSNPAANLPARRSKAALGWCLDRSRRRSRVTLPQPNVARPPIRPFPSE